MWHCLDSKVPPCGPALLSVTKADCIGWASSREIWGTNPNKIQSSEAQPLPNSHTPYCSLHFWGKKELWKLRAEEPWSIKARGWGCSRWEVWEGHEQCLEEPIRESTNPFKKHVNTSKNTGIFLQWGIVHLLDAKITIIVILLPTEWNI